MDISIHGSWIFVCFLIDAPSDGPINMKSLCLFVVAYLRCYDTLCC